jgi:hypothetical protein
VDLITVRQCKTTQIITQSVDELPVSTKSIDEVRAERGVQEGRWSAWLARTFRNLLTFAHIQLD